MASCSALICYYSPLLLVSPHPLMLLKHLVKLPLHIFSPCCFSLPTMHLSQVFWWLIASPFWVTAHVSPLLLTSSQPPPAPLLLILLPCFIFLYSLQYHLASYLLLSVSSHQNIRSFRTEPLFGFTAKSNSNRYFPFSELQALGPHLLQLCALSIALQLLLKSFSQVQSSPGYWGVEIIFTHVQLK